MSVQTLGRWTSGGESGRYKVIVTTEGWEHIWSRAFVQWLPDPRTPDDDWKVTATAELIPPIAPGIMILVAVVRQQKPGMLLITLNATPNQDLRELGVTKAVYVYQATSPGVVKLLESKRR